MGKCFLGGVVGFVCGIFLYSFVDFGLLGLLFALLVSSTFLLLWFLKRDMLSLLVCIFILGICIGAGRVLLVPTTLPEAFVPFLETETTVEGVVVADPDVRETSQRLTIEIHAEGAVTRVLVVAPSYPVIRYGETIRASGTFERPTPFETTTGRTFAYEKFLAKDGIFVLLKNAQVAVIAPRQGILTHIRGTLSDSKFAGLSYLAVSLPEPQSALAGGLILGGKQGLGESLLNDFITSGLIHIVVLSGYNVMIVADFVFRICKLFVPRLAGFTAIATILSFVLLAGAGSASVRAGVMASIALFGRATGRTYDAFRALIIAGVLMLLWNPLTLAYDPGFQLSFIATLGLIFGAPIAERWLAFVSSKFLREIISSTVAAQIAVLPLLLYQNGLFSLVALPANILVLPVVPFAMLFSAVAGVAGFLVPVIAPVIAFPAYLLLSYITGVVEITANIPFSAIAIPAFPFVLVVISYVLLGIYIARQRVLQTVSRTLPS